jgi:RNA polymerase sigma-70 factor (ECF subfamily)
MSPESLNRRLCSITTLWGIVREAHDGEAEAAREAQRQLLARYGGAIRRYLVASLRDPEVAADLFQEFALRFLNGNYRKADPERGRFRDYVKTILYHLITHFHKQRQRHLHQLAPDHPEPAVEPAPDPERDPEFLSAWREDLLARCWTALAEAESRGGQPLYTALRFQAENPAMRSPQMAEELGRRLGKPLTSTGIRQLLFRARGKFADMLVEEVAHSLGNPTDEQLEEEFRELGLLEHCRPALERRGRKG